MFSTAVKLGDLNDFIAPSQACVVNISGKPVQQTQDDQEVGTVQLQQRGAGPRGASVEAPAAGPTPQPQPVPADPVKISLHDCLACSGCVTSAETVLLQQQSAAELEAKLADPSATVLVTLSPQSITSLAVACGLAPRDAARRLAAALRTLGAAAVFDLSASRDVALLETAAEFVHRYRLSQRGATELASVGAEVAGGGASSASGAALPPPPPPAAESASASAQQPALGGQVQNAEGGAAAAAPPPLPMLASACPGWVCYAEKTHGTFVLPHVSAAKSPQAVAGTLVKRAWCVAAGVPPAAAFHCAVMPCYDKKLEAAREDFYVPGSQVPETDCVLATTELLELLQQRGLDLPSLPPPSGPAFDSLLRPGQRLRQGGEFAGLPGGSGGYLEHVFRTAARELFGRELPPGPLPMKVGRNADFRECTLEVGGRPVLRFASAYGFRNIQGLMRKVRLGRCEYDYIEVMACPAGCLNGGGQVRPAKGETPQQLIERLEVAYHAESGGLDPQRPQDSPEAQRVYAEVVQGSVGSPAAAALFHTQYHRREKSVTATLGDW